MSIEEMNFGGPGNYVNGQGLKGLLTSTPTVIIDQNLHIAFAFAKYIYIYRSDLMDTTPVFYLSNT